MQKPTFILAIIYYFISLLILTFMFICGWKLTGLTFDSNIISSYINILIFTATISGPVAALFLYSRWKEQHNKQAEKDLINESLKEFVICRADLDMFVLSLWSNNEISPKECDILPSQITNSKFNKNDTFFHKFLYSFYKASNSLDVVLFNNSNNSKFKFRDEESHVYKYTNTTIQQYFHLSYKLKDLGQILLHMYEAHYLDNPQEEFLNHAATISLFSEDHRDAHDELIKLLNNMIKAI